MRADLLMPFATALCSNIAIDDPAAKVRLCYDFISPHAVDIRIAGAIEMRDAGKAQAVADSLNADYGAGSHWVELVS